MHIELGMDDITEAIREFVRAAGQQLVPAQPVRYFVFDEDSMPFEIDRVVARIALTFEPTPAQGKEEGDAGV